MKLATRPGLARRCLKPPTATATLIFSVLTAACLSAADQLLVIGDSLSKEYTITGPGIGADVGVTHIRNWCEILHERRNRYFDLGPQDEYPDLRLTGHRSNWSVPGSFAGDWPDYLDSSFPQDILYGIDEIEGQVSAGTERIVVFVGGNEVRTKYQDLYNNTGSSATTWSNQVYADITSIVSWIRARNASVPLVLVSIPHLGCTPKIASELPFNTTKTGRVTTALTALNNRLANYAENRGIGWCPEVYEMTRDLVTADHYCLGGVPIWKNPPRGDGNNRHLFLGDGFHPNTPAQAVFAQRILDAFNAKYVTNIPRLTNSQILTDMLGLRADQAFDDWTKAYGLPNGQRGTADDPDKDGVKNIVEYALDLEPQTSDAMLLPRPAVRRENGIPLATLTWRPHALHCHSVSIQAESSTNLQQWAPVPATQIQQLSDGSYQAWAPAPAGKVYLRLRCALVL